MTVTHRDIEDALSNLGIAVKSISTNRLLDRAEQPEVEIIGFLTSPRKPQNKFTPKRILKNGDYMTVLWADGTKTIVKRAEDEPASDYAAFTAAVAIRAYGSNSALKRIIEQKVEIQKKRKKK